MSHRHAAARLLGGLITLGSVLGAGAVLVSFAGGELHPFDSVGHFRLHIAVALVLIGLGALFFRRWIGAGVATVGAVVGLATTLPFVLPQPSAEAAGASYTLLQMNLRYDAPEQDPAVQLVAELRPDVVTLDEVTESWRARFEALESAYPYQHYCGTYGKGGTAVLSRRPFATDPETSVCRIEDGFAARGVDFNGRVVTIAALHLDWPWPRHHWGQVRRLEPILPKLPKPAILAGDFNAAPWSAAVGTVAADGGWRVVKGIGPSFMLADLRRIPAHVFGLPIDNVLASADVRVLEAETLAPTGSDHLPVLVRFSVEAGPSAAPDAPSVAARVNAN
ncbi:endonuclease/exonuclease/phosphatase family protein [Aureimonas sp. AU4]|uniref:endonuclease/exonuclease/phosphatase family protein n=1 Tax=Aureimonas sp. AU4 TaxID=1638163 RepID=UPI00078289EE|nr:endonuclease/exonuclease/phosphatase family protein [Aureimonas sp. AU4]